jgi:predicted RNase H-like HicB family nuclease
MKIKEATKVHLLMLSEDGEEVPQPSSLQVTN